MESMPDVLYKVRQGLLLDIKDVPMNRSHESKSRFFLVPQSWTTVDTFHSPSWFITIALNWRLHSVNTWNDRIGYISVESGRFGLGLTTL